MFDEIKDDVQSQQISGEQVQQPDQPTQKEHNLSNIREKWEKERQAREQAERRAAELEQQLARIPQKASSQVEASPEVDIPDDEIVDGRTYKLQRERLRNEYRQDLEQIKAQIAFDSAERILRDKYSDFTEVVNEENLKNFKFSHPEEYSSMMANPDPYAKMKTAYTNMLSLGIVDKPSSPSYAQGRPSRPASPKAAASVSANQNPTTPLAQFSDMAGRRVLTEEMKEANRKRINEDKEKLRQSGYNVY